MLKIAEQDARLPDLLKQVEAGETVLITRAGRAVVEVRPVAEPKGPPWSSVQQELSWLDWHRLSPAALGDASVDFREMRDRE